MQLSAAGCTRNARQDTPTYDLAGNMTYDGLYQYTFDAWNRMTKVQRAYRDASSALQTASTVGTIRYDGLGRRIVKAVTGSADWDCTYNFYNDGRRIIEERDGSGNVLKQNVWGLQYVDELIQVGVALNPGGTNCTQVCGRYFWACQDANYNILGLVSATGLLTERYEYTPYGQRTVFSHGWMLADCSGDGAVNFDDYQTLTDHWQTSDGGTGCDYTEDGVVNFDDYTILTNDWVRCLPTADPLVLTPRAESFRGYYTMQSGALTETFTPYGLCDFGHQGLQHDKEWGLVNNRNRMLHTTLCKFLQPDPGPEGAIGHRNPYGKYIDGMNVYQYVRSSPLSYVDWNGTEATSTSPTSTQPGASQPASQPLQPDPAIDGNKDVRTYNCSGLAFRNYEFMSLDDTTKKLAAYRKLESCAKTCKACEMKLWLWQYDLTVAYYPVGKPEQERYQDSHPDFHVVGGRVSCTDGSDLANVYSKNGPAPIKGPDWAKNLKLPDREDIGRRRIDDEQCQLFKVRTKVKESCYCWDDKSH